MWKVWAWSEGVRNFGDELGPVILSRLGHPVERVDDISEANIVTIGSLMEHAAIHARPGTVVWGSGVMYGDLLAAAHLDVRAVRGRITAHALGVDVPLGDPGCLVPYLWHRPPPRYGVGVVRHYMDTRDYPWADLVIDARGDVDEVIEQIGSCRRVASSSLHGLIVADAWGIPTMRLHHPEVAGGDVKWADWISGAGDPESLVAALPSQHADEDTPDEDGQVNEGTEHERTP